MNKKDIILIAGLLLLAGLSYALLVMGEKESGNRVVIMLDGVQYGTYDLNRNQEIPVDGRDGHNLVVVEDGKVFMQEADCPDQYCVKQGKISDQSESLICLPHKLIVELDMTETEKDKSGNENSEDIDSISK